jgi:hypothetical protein
MGRSTDWEIAMSMTVISTIMDGIQVENFTGGSSLLVTSTGQYIDEAGEAFTVSSEIGPAFEATVDGLVYGETTAFFVATNTLSSNFFINGTVEGGAQGFLLQSAATIVIGSQGAVNGGSGSGIEVDIGGVSITNAGALTSQSGSGINIESAAVGVNIANSGTLSSVSNDGSQMGLWNSGTITDGIADYSPNPDAFNTIANTGIVLGAVILGGGDTLSNSGAIEDGVFEQVPGAVPAVTNSGHIAGGIEFDSGTIDNSGDITDGILINSGMIDNSGDIAAPGSTEVAIQASGTAQLDIINSGHIVGSIQFGDGANTYDGSLGSIAGGAVLGGAGNDTLTGGAGTDVLDGGTGVDVLDGMGGNDALYDEGTQATIDGGDGNDVVVLGSVFNASDQIDGGAGKDTLLLFGAYSAGVVLGADTLTNVEKIVLSTGFSYNLTMNDNNVAAGARLVVDASTLGSSNSLKFNGAAESDGRFTITGGAGNDTLTGGAGNDVLTGNGGNNLFTGGMGADHIVSAGGHDHFIYNDASESTGVAHDVITGFNALEGKFDLDVTVTGINSEVTSGRLSTANFDANLATAIGSAQLAAGHAVQFTPTVGNLAGHTFLIVDANGAAGYQTGQDYVFDLVSATHLTSLATTDFI